MRALGLSVSRKASRSVSERPASKSLSDFGPCGPEIELCARSLGPCSAFSVKTCLDLENGLQGLLVSSDELLLSLGIVVDAGFDVGDPVPKSHGKITIQFDRPRQNVVGGNGDFS